MIIQENIIVNRVNQIAIRDLSTGNVFHFILNVEMNAYR